MGLTLQNFIPLAILEGKRLLLEFYRRGIRSRITPSSRERDPEVDIFRPHFLFAPKRHEPLRDFSHSIAMENVRPKQE